MPTFAEEVEVPVAASRFWASVKNNAEIFPKIVPQVFASITDAPGSLPRGEVGSERIVKFGPVAPEGAFVKEKITAIDDGSMYIAQEDIEGGHLAKGFTKWVSTVKVVPVDAMSSKLYTTLEYEGGSETVLHEAIEGYRKVAKAVVNYLETTGAYA